VFRLLGKAMTVGAALAVLVLSGCGGNDQSGAPAAVASEVQLPSRAPSVQLLNSMLQRALDPQVPAKDKLDLVQGATAADAPLFDQLVRLRNEHPDTTWQISNVHLVSEGRAVATVSALMNGTNQHGEVQLVFDQGRWKLDGNYTCELLRQFGRTAPSCGR
jgi:hypothetical protein